MKFKLLHSEFRKVNDDFYEVIDTYTFKRRCLSFNQKPKYVKSYVSFVVRHPDVKAIELLRKIEILKYQHQLLQERINILDDNEAGELTLDGEIMKNVTIDMLNLLQEKISKVEEEISNSVIKK